MYDKCGVFAALSQRRGNVFRFIYWGLLAQNHRGHQSYGFLTLNEQGFRVRKGRGLIPNLPKNQFNEWSENLSGFIGLGHVRYATSGKVSEEALMRDAQPVIVGNGGEKLALAYNGNLVNLMEIKREIDSPQSITGFSDAWLMAYFLLNGISKHDEALNVVEEFMKIADGAYSSVILLSNGNLIIFRDPLGIKPLWFGVNEEVVAASSESVGLDIIDLKESRVEVKPGEAITISPDGEVRREVLVKGGRKAFCSFEFAYFSRPDSMINGKYVYEVREEFGRNLAKENEDVVAKADLIVSVPETASDSAYGIHEVTGIRWERAIVRHRYVTQRAFILVPKEREEMLSKKFNVLGEKIRGKRIILMDDSIVRGDTTKCMVKRLKESGAREVHVFVTFPKIVAPCLYGVDMATYTELIGARYGSEEIARIIGADSVRYQSLEGFVKATGMKAEELCLGCITGRYPTEKSQRLADLARGELERGIRVSRRVYERSLL